MNDPMIVSILAGVAVITLIVGLGLAFGKSIGSQAEQRLEDLTNKPKKDLDLSGGILLRPPAVDLEQPPFWTRLIPNLENLTRLYEQADVNMPFNRFMGIGRNADNFMSDFGQMKSHGLGHKKVILNKKQLHGMTYVIYD